MQGKKNNIIVAYNTNIIIMEAIQREIKVMYNVIIIIVIKGRIYRKVRAPFYNDASSGILQLQYSARV